MTLVISGLMWVKQCHRPPITGNGKDYIPPKKNVIWVHPIFTIKRFYMVEVYYPFVVFIGYYVTYINHTPHINHTIPFFV